MRPLWTPFCIIPPFIPTQQGQLLHVYMIHIASLTQMLTLNTFEKAAEGSVTPVLSVDFNRVPNPRSQGQYCGKGLHS